MWGSNSNENKSVIKTTMFSTNAFKYIHVKYLYQMKITKCMLNFLNFKNDFSVCNGYNYDAENILLLLWKIYSTMT